MEGGKTYRLRPKIVPNQKSQTKMRMHSLAYAIILPSRCDTKRNRNRLTTRKKQRSKPVTFYVQPLRCSVQGKTLRSICIKEEKEKQRK